MMIGNDSLVSPVLFFKGPPSTDKAHFFLSSFSSNQIATMSEANFHNKNTRAKSLWVEGGPLIKYFPGDIFGKLVKPFKIGDSLIHIKDGQNEYFIEIIVSVN